MQLLFITLQSTVFITNDAIILALLFLCLGVVFYTANLENRFFKKWYTFFPPLLLCYFLPSLLNYPLNWIDGSSSKLYNVAKDYFLPASLILMCLSIDARSLMKLGSKALIMFFTTVVAVIIGGPIALFVTKLFLPEVIESNPEVWKGFSTIAGSWIGGSANQTAMKEIYNVPQDLFGTMLVIDVLIAYIWMALLLFGAERSNAIDRWLKADNSSIAAVKEKSKTFRKNIQRIPETDDLIKLFSVTFVSVGCAHLVADMVVPLLSSHEGWIKEWKLTAILSKFFWIAIISTTIGIMLSFTKVKQLEGIGASKVGTVFIYFMITTLGMQMNVKSIAMNISLLWVGLIWMLVHAMIIIIVAKLIKAPFFFLAVGSQACIGGPASAPIVASAFDPALAPIGVILAVLGYAVGTYGAIICAQLMSLV